MATFEKEMVSRLYPDGAYGRCLLPKSRYEPKQLWKQIVCIQENNFYVRTVIYVISSITPYKIN